jgi:hypothetical protein
MARFCEHNNEPSVSKTGGVFFDLLSGYLLASQE